VDACGNKEFCAITVPRQKTKRNRITVPKGNGILSRRKQPVTAASKKPAEVAGSGRQWLVIAALAVVACAGFAVYQTSIAEV